MNCVKPVEHNSHSEAIVSKTKQSFKGECDIHQILSKYDVSGIPPITNPLPPQYGDFTKTNFQKSANLVAEFKSSWEHGGFQQDYTDYADYVKKTLFPDDEPEEAPELTEEQSEEAKEKILDDTVS